MAVINIQDNKHKIKQFTDQTKKLKNYQIAWIELSNNDNTKAPKI